MNLRGSVANSGLSETDAQVEMPTSTMSNVMFRGVSNAISELSQDVDDGFTDAVDNELLAQEGAFSAQADNVAVAMAKVAVKRESEQP